jgi:hypothetical protein
MYKTQPMLRVVKVSLVRNIEAGGKTGGGTTL